MNPLVGNSLQIAPKPDEIEVSVFGPGYGESIVIHVGENKWIVVDSCIEPMSQEPAPLAYFRQLGIDPATTVQQIIATHWHDDHVCGLGRLFKACTSAQFACSDALRSDEFIELVEAYGTRSMMRTSGVQEMHEVLNTLEERRREQREQYFMPKFAVADRCLWRDSLKTQTSQYICSLHALSPSDTAILAAKQEILKLLPHTREIKRGLFPLTPNHAASVILHSNFVSESNPYGKASVFKIPHHGSQTAHHPGIWTEMLRPNPIAVLSPFRRGSVTLPAEKDVERISSFTQTAYSTTGIQQKTRKRERTVEKTIKETVRNIRQVNPSIGQVRVRAKLSGDWNIELFGNAIPLQELYPH